jgi:hypothetical protein
MALMVYLGGNSQAGEVKGALEDIRRGIATLKKLDGLRAEAIAVSAANFGAVFSVNSDEASQALNDRWAAVLSKFYDTGNSEYAVLRDLLNAVTSTP